MTAPSLSPRSQPISAYDRSVAPLVRVGLRCAKSALLPVRCYLPPADLRVVLQPSPTRTHCPYKGDASYFSINANGKSIENSIWTYETPFPAMAEISGHLAFYPDKVTIEEVA